MRAPANFVAPLLARRGYANVEDEAAWRVHDPGVTLAGTTQVLPFAPRFQAVMEPAIAAGHARSSGLWPITSGTRTGSTCRTTPSRLRFPASGSVARTEPRPPNGVEQPVDAGAPLGAGTARSTPLREAGNWARRRPNPAELTWRDALRSGEPILPSRTGRRPALSEAFPGSSGRGTGKGRQLTGSSAASSPGSSTCCSAMVRGPRVEKTTMFSGRAALPR